MTPTHPPTSPASAPDGVDPAPHWTVLLVDDEPDILGSIQLLLERSKKGVRVVTASSGAAGLQVLAAGKVDLLVSDFKMPGMDGIEFLAKARELRPELPRVMFTAYADEDLARRAFTEAFVTDFLAKTLAPKELVAKIEGLLVEHADPGPDSARAPSGPGGADPLAGPEGAEGAERAEGSAS